MVGVWNNLEVNKWRKIHAYNVNFRVLILTS